MKHDGFSVATWTVMNPRDRQHHISKSEPVCFQKASVHMKLQGEMYAVCALMLMLNLDLRVDSEREREGGQRALFLLSLK